MSPERRQTAKANAGRQLPYYTLKELKSHLRRSELTAEMRVKVEAAITEREQKGA